MREIVYDFNDNKVSLLFTDNEAELPFDTAYWKIIYVVGTPVELAYQGQAPVLKKDTTEEFLLSIVKQVVTEDNVCYSYVGIKDGKKS